MKKRIFWLLTLYVVLFSNTVSKAATQDQVSNAIKNYTIRYLTVIDEDPRSKVMHTDTIQGDMSYNYITPITSVSGNFTTYYATPDIFCRTMYVKALAFDLKEVPVPSGRINYLKGRAQVFAENPGTDNGARGSSFEMIDYYPKTPNPESRGSSEEINKWISENAKPGDILECFHNTMIYLGDVKISEKDEETEENIVHDVIANFKWVSLDTHVGGKLPRGMFSLSKDRNDRSYSAPGQHYSFDHTKLNYPAKACYLGSGACPVRIWRLKPKIIEALNAELFNDGSGLKNKYYYDFEDTMDLTTIDEEDKEVFSKFYYNGIPDGKYSVTKTFFQMIIDSLSQVFDYLVGILLLPVRMVFIGWTAIAEKIINDTMTALSGGENVTSLRLDTAEINTDEGVSIEKIIFNDVSIFDVNFFNFNDEKE